MYTPLMVVMVDLDDTRLATARSLGANETINSATPDAKQKPMALTDGQGFDSVIEAVGNPATFSLGQELVAVGGAIANVGVHGTKVDLHLETLWDRNINYPFHAAVTAYTTSQAASQHQALKVAIDFAP
ncbi:hypothetical protein NUU61_005813 [Penicillium alfredii]|uniref:Alcohol dehydrogenase-like C-terminal domain-containing protein n=1 Tax=Penicillium alfredii TaxID=1506179 RepID=A0A9W9FAL7_9EURO|nr:uncharacterized protein NUU61_005813 [Penicillium alfredii]KAJ5096457.1 hypothetical protein NUU61_005813 [Penicillium alfredii]